MKKLDEKGFIEKAKQIHGDRYDYSLVEYVSYNSLIKINCIKHGIFEQTPKAHITKRGCPLCGCETQSKSIKYDTNSFIEKAKQIHGDRYDYSLVEYVKSTENVKIKCKEHGIFEQKPVTHLQGCGCPLCAKNKKMSEQEIIQKISSFEKNDFTYISVSTKTCVLKCERCDCTFEKSYNGLSQGEGCPFCSGKKMDTEFFLRKAKQIHGDKYDYSQTLFTNSATKLKIFCRKCETYFFQNHNAHLCGCGCPNCFSSKGEEKIAQVLNQFHVKYETQKKFAECKNKRELPFDFYLPDQNIVIEYQGIQHFKPRDFFGGKKSFEYRQKNDKIKRTFCEENNIQMIEISYKDFNNIEKIIKSPLLIYEQPNS